MPGLRRNLLSVKKAARSTIGILLPRVTPNFATVPSAKTCCDIVNVPASQSRETQQVAHHHNSPRLFTGANWLRSLQTLSHLLLSPIANAASTCATTTMETAPAPLNAKHMHRYHTVQSQDNLFRVLNGGTVVGTLAPNHTGLRHSLTTLLGITP